MLFFRCDVTVEGESPQAESDKEKLAEQIQTQTALYNGDHPETALYLCINSKINVTVCAALPLEERWRLQAAIDDYMLALSYKAHRKDVSEITLPAFRRMLQQASHFGFIEDPSDELERLGLDDLIRARIGRSVEEQIIREPLNMETASKLAAKMLCAGTMIPELERIFCGNPKAFQGHPVHYIVTSVDRNASQEMTEILLGALWAAGRLPGRRFCTISSIGDALDREDISGLYSSLAGGTAVLNLCGDESEEEFSTDKRWETAMETLNAVKKHRRDVLSVICADSRCEGLIRRIEESLGNVALVRIGEDIVDCKAGVEYLLAKARADGVNDVDDLCEKLSDKERYSRHELDGIYLNWHNVYIRTKVYGQYADIRVDQKQRMLAPAGSAVEELDAMIGLTQAKRAIHEIIDYNKAQKILFDKGFIKAKPSMHMVFTGNPGTAKTTVARLFARIMKENTILSDGRLIEVGRADLVGKYVGWTAKTVKERFKQAKGSVLFIDEAYSLVEERGLYGDEAINTIVQEMENARDSTIVIFAGYTDRMREFIDRNPGLKSRIAFHVDFPDYTPDELTQIFQYNLKKENLSADEGAYLAVKELLASAAKGPDFGNGRYVRTLIERATMRQAVRLLRTDLDQLSKTDVTTIKEEDIPLPESEKRTNVRQIGF